MAERGLFKFGGLLFIGMLAIAAVAYATGGGRPAAEAAPSTLDEPRTGAVPLATAEDAAPADAVCAADGAPRPLGDEILESSGVAASRAHAGTFWTHNDSGDPVLYAVDAQGRTAGRVRVTGAAVEDWEDASADGRWVVLRTLRAAMIHPAAELAGGGTLSPRRVDLRALDEKQGEGIAFTPDGSLIVTSEGGKKSQPATFARLSCTLR